MKEPGAVLAFGSFHMIKEKAWIGSPRSFWNPAFPSNPTTAILSESTMVSDCLRHVNAVGLGIQRPVAIPSRLGSVPPTNVPNGKIRMMFSPEDIFTVLTSCPTDLSPSTMTLGKLGSMSTYPLLR